MIGRIHGILLEKQAPYLLVDVAGVGYELQAPMTTFFVLPDVSEVVTLHTHFSVSESAQQLFGFIHQKDRGLFRQLIKVNGVGPRMALGLMSMHTDAIVTCIMENNVAALVKIPGVGKKTAERLVIEMRDRLKAWDYEPSLTASTSTPSSIDLDSRSMIQEAESALVALGYKPAEAAKAVSRSRDSEVCSSEELIRLALKSMLPSGTRL